MSNATSIFDSTGIPAVIAAIILTMLAAILRAVLRGAGGNHSGGCRCESCENSRMQAYVAYMNSTSVSDVASPVESDGLRARASPKNNK